MWQLIDDPEKPSFVGALEYKLPCVAESINVPREITLPLAKG